MENFGTGDINLACALMSIGIPMDDAQPCAIVSHENGNVYSRYYFNPISFDGKFKTSDMSNAWSFIHTLPTNHPLRVISNFVRQSEKGYRITDWLGLACDIYDLKHVSNMETANDHINAFPNNDESYCLAFVANRVELYALHTKAVQRVYMSQGKASAMIDVRLPQYQKKELTNRLNG